MNSEWTHFTHAMCVGYFCKDVLNFHYNAISVRISRCTIPSRKLG